MKTKLFFAAVSAMMLAACSNDDNYVAYEGPVEAQFTAGISSAKTRSSDDTYEVWKEDTTIGVITTKVANSGGELTLANTKMSKYVNVKYTLQETDNDGQSAKFDATENKIYFNDGTYIVDFAAYSPYYDGEADLTQIPIESTSSSVDYIFASATGKTYSNNTVNFAFEHVMSKLTINITQSNEIEGDISKVSLDKLKQSGTFNAKTGATTLTTGDAATLEYTSDFAAQSFYLIPQTAGDIALSIKIGEETYSTTIKPALAKGMEYTYNITAKKYGLELTGCTIKAYGNGGTSNQEALL
jgi:hypothetical protein